MTKPIERDPIYRGRRFQNETIELCVRWYITYRLSYRDLVAMMAERGIVVSHTTIMRWVLRYVPEYEKRWARYARPVNSSWRMDETAVSVRGGRHYLYRAVDKRGKSVGSVLRADRGMDAAKEFFRNAVVTNHFQWPTTVNLDGNAASHRALRLLGDEDPKWKSVEVRCCRYSTTPSSRIIARSNAVVHRCSDSSHLRRPPSHLPVSNWQIEFANGSSHLGAVIQVAPGRLNNFGIEHWRRVQVRIRRNTNFRTLIRQCTRTHESTREAKRHL
jgi:transposase-like protein